MATAVMRQHLTESSRKKVRATEVARTFDYYRYGCKLRVTGSDSFDLLVFLLAAGTPTALLATLTAAALLALGLALGVAGQTGIASLIGNIGVAVLLATPVAGLLATWSELRALRPTHAWLAVAVLAVLTLATIVALAARA